MRQKAMNNKLIFIKTKAYIPDNGYLVNQFKPAHIS
jgi:hypothetical protein